MLCMLNKKFSDSFHLHLKSLLEDLGVSLLSDSTLTLNQDYRPTTSFTSFARLCLSELPFRLLLRGGNFSLLGGYCRKHTLALSSTLGGGVS